MSVKKLLVLSAAGIVAISATAAMAGGPDRMAAPVVEKAPKSVYAELGFGYDQTDWANYSNSRLVGNAGNSLYSPNSHGKGYLTASADVGYNFTKNFALELGYFYLPTTSGGSTANTIGGISAAGGITVNSWLGYLDAKLSVPVVENFDLFGKVGAAYRQLYYSFSGTFTGPMRSISGPASYWTPIFAAGADYDWGNFILGAQYTYLPGHNQVQGNNPAFGAPGSAPEANLYTGTLGYKFNV